MKKLTKKVLLACRKLLLLVENIFDKNYLAADVPVSKIVSHQKWQRYLYEIGNKPGMRILEIGSREVTGELNSRIEFSKAEYVGFDYYPGRNIDVVGDVLGCPLILKTKKNSILFIQVLALNILQCPGLLPPRLRNC